MKVFIVLCLAVASTCALNLRGSKFVDISPESRIHKGLQAKPNEFPYEVGLRLSKSTPEVTSWCSGSLIARNWVLTAAYCAERASKKDGRITVYLGSIDLQGGKKVSATKVIIHPKYGYRADAYNEYDIALVRIPAVSLSKSINIVPLPAISNKYSNYVNESGIVSGWGETSDFGPLTNTLQYTFMTAVDNSVCSNLSSSPFIICLSNPIGTTCLGDAGSPLVLEESGILVGLAGNSAISHCYSGKPVVIFTRVSSYRAWIKEKSGV